MEPAGAGLSELAHKDALCSAQWDHPDGAGLRARYAIFSAQRTGSEWLCDYLRQCAIGVPFEYFNHVFMLRIGARLGCALPGSRIDLERYVALLEPLRARHGIFGTKLQPDQLRTISAGDGARAAAFLRRFDKVILLRRRDTLLQAISLARAHLTHQWQLYRDDAAISIALADEHLFRMIGERRAKIEDDDRYMAALTGTLDPAAVRALCYEDLAQAGALDGVADWLWDALGEGGPRPAPDRRLELPRKMDESEARAIRQRYLSSIRAG